MSWELLPNRRNQPARLQLLQYCSWNYHAGKMGPGFSTTKSLILVDKQKRLYWAVLQLSPATTFKFSGEMRICCPYKEMGGEWPDVLHFHMNMGL